MCSFDFEKFVKKCLDGYIETKKTKKCSEIKNIKNQNYKCFYTSYEKCEDNYVGDISCGCPKLFILPEFRFNKKQELTIKRKTNKSKIVVLLESPHRAEYSFNMIAPALGNTGQKLHNYLPKLLHDNALISNEDTEIYLVNSIQYQCSLGFETKDCRDIIFNALWGKQEIKDALENRIKTINPTNIIVATTTSLREKTVEFIKEKFNNVNIWIADSHPSFWTKKTNIELL